MTDNDKKTEQQNNETTKQPKTKEKGEPKPKALEDKPSLPSKPSGPSESKKEIKQEKPEKKEPEIRKEDAPKPVKEVKVSGKLGKIIEEIEKLTVIELADLVQALEEKFGVSGVPVAASVATQPQTQPEQAAGPSPEQTVFNVVLAQTGPNKIQVIKALRGIKPTLGLQEAKKMTEETPQEVLSQVNKKEAEEAKKKLEEVGAKVELK